MIKDVMWISTKNTLDSIRHNGITTEEGICELIDNSIDARATNINILLEEIKNKEYTYTIIDDGIGIPTTFPDPEDINGLPLQGIRYALSVGGKMNLFGSKKIGRFGFGLSNTVAELSSRTEIYSRCSDDNNWRTSFYDYEWLREHDLIVPEEQFQDPPLLSYPDNGTVVKIFVKPAQKLKLKPLQARLLKRIGLSYSKFLRSNVNINIKIKNLKGKWHEVEVEPADYLWKDPASREVKEFGSSLPKGEVEIIIDEDHELAEIVEDMSQLPKTIRIEMALINAKALSEKTGIKPAVGFGEWSKLLERLGIGMDSQGFALSRNGRIIETGLDIGYIKIAPLNYFRAVIHFDDTLDDLFGIQNNKNKSRIYEPLSNLIGSRCNPTLVQIREDHKKIIDLIKRTPLIRPEKIPMAETHLEKIQPILPRVKLTLKEQEAAQEKIKEKVELLKQEIIVIGNKEISEIKQSLDSAINLGDDKSAENEALKLEVAKQEMKQNIMDIESRFAEQKLVRKMKPRPIGTGEIYSLEHLGDQVWITMNSDTPFFHNVYARAAMKKWDEFLLDLMIFSMAYSEHIAKMDKGNPTRSTHWVENRRDISTMIHRFIEPLSNQNENNYCSICGEIECYCDTDE